MPGTTIPFVKVTGTDRVMQITPTRYQCITCMGQYKRKSIEELRLEDYQENRGRPQINSTSSNWFRRTSRSFPPFGNGQTGLAAPAADTGPFAISSEASNPVAVFGQLASVRNFRTPAQEDLQGAGTSIPFSAKIAAEATKINNITYQIMEVRYQTITCMEEYKTKSLEELRWEDYQLNRKKAPQASISTNVFGETVAPTNRGGNCSGDTRTLGASSFRQSSGATGDNSSLLRTSILQPRGAGTRASTSTARYVPVPAARNFVKSTATTDTSPIASRNDQIPCNSMRKRKADDDVPQSTINQSARKKECRNGDLCTSNVTLNISPGTKNLTVFINTANTLKLQMVEEESENEQ